MRRISLWLFSTIAAVVLMFTYRTSTSGATGGPQVVANAPGVVSGGVPATGGAPFELIRRLERHRRRVEFCRSGVDGAGKQHGGKCRENESPATPSHRNPPCCCALRLISPASMAPEPCRHPSVFFATRDRDREA